MRKGKSNKLARLSSCSRNSRNFEGSFQSHLLQTMFRNTFKVHILRPIIRRHFQPGSFLHNERFEQLCQGELSFSFAKVNRDTRQHVSRLFWGLAFYQASKLQTQMTGYKLEVTVFSNVSTIPVAASGLMSQSLRNNRYVVSNSQRKNIIKLSLSLTIICSEIYAAFHYR